jgi:eukaryotic-like serine/threonine-protein kinase
MICPSCKGENAPRALQCAHCGAALPKADDRLGPHLAQEDRTIDGPAPSARARPQESPNVSILSKTPSGTLPAGEQAADSADLIARPGGALGGSRPTSLSRGASRASLPGSLESGMDFGPRFRIEELLGAGGMGKVYKAFDKVLSRTVALKTLQPELVTDPTVIQRFKQELLLASKISHKNILRIHDLNEFEGTNYITMAFIEGKDLNQLLKEEGPLSFERTLKIIRQLCEALDAAHAEGVVHRDFKPHNVLVGKDDHAYVSDFGLATSLESAQMGMTRTGAVVGTPRYMSPEQVEGKPVDRRSDIYSLGIVFYEMATGQVPFSGESTWQLMYQRVQHTPRNVKELNPALPDYVAQVIMHCLEKEPPNRYQSAKEMLADLDAGRSPALSTSFVPSRTIQINIPAIQRKWRYLGGGGILLLLVLFFAIPTTRRWVIRPSKTARSSSSAAVSGLPSLANGKYIAVLPFRVVGDQSSLGYVADGLGEALSAKLFQVKDVHLTSQAVSAKADSKAPLSQVAKDLGVNLIVHGTVQGSRDNLRITVNLDNVVENRLIWSQDFAGVSGDLLTIEDQIYSRLVEALETKPSSADLAVATVHPTENIEAYDLYLKGRNALNGNPDESNTQAAMNLFSSALQKDPGFALAYAGLSDANLQMYSQKKDKFWSDKAVEAARQAAKLNEKLPEVHFALGSAYAASGQTVQAVAEQKRALELTPNSDEAYRRLGRAYEANGQKDEAIRALEKAVELNPYYWNNLAALGNAYFAFGELDKSLRVYAQVIQIEPENPAGYSNLGMVYFSLGKYEESISYFQKAVQLKPSAAIYSNLGTAFFYLKRYPEALPMFQKAVEMSPEDAVFMGNLADGYRLAGDKEQARATYEKAISLAYKELRVNPRNASIAGNLALYYAKSGDLQQAKVFIKKARALDHSDVYLMYAAAVVDTINNQPADAVKELTVAMEKGFSANDVEVEPEFIPLRSRADFQSMMKRFAAKKR